MHLGFGELLLIFLVILLIFGSSKLPQLGDALGRGIKNFKKATTEEPIDVTPAFSPFQSLGDLTVSAFFDDTRMSG